jgi:hypothetical protein
MGESPPESETVRPGNWRRAIAPLFAVLVLAAVVCRRDVHLSWSGTALVLVVIVAATSLYWRFVTQKVLPSLAGRRGTWQTRSGRLKVTVTCKSCGNSMDVTSGRGDSCPSCGQEMGHTS